MSKKEIKFPKRPGAVPVETADAWVNARRGDVEAVKPETPAAPEEPMKRLTIDIPEGLHIRVKSQCARRGIKMADEIRSLLEQHFPKEN
jgi:hypothetical protein